MRIDGLALCDELTIIFHGRRDLSTIQTYVALGGHGTGARDRRRRAAAGALRPRPRRRLRPRPRRARLYRDQAANLRDAMIAADTVLAVWYEPLAEMTAAPVTVERARHQPGRRARAAAAPGRAARPRAPAARRRGVQRAHPRRGPPAARHRLHPAAAQPRLPADRRPRALPRRLPRARRRKRPPARRTRWPTRRSPSSASWSSPASEGPDAARLRPAQGAGRLGAARARAACVGGTAAHPRLPAVVRAGTTARAGIDRSGRAATLTTSRRRGVDPVMPGSVMRLRGSLTLLEADAGPDIPMVLRIVHVPVRGSLHTGPQIGASARFRAARSNKRRVAT